MALLKGGGGGLGPERSNGASPALLVPGTGDLAVGPPVPAVRGEVEGLLRGGEDEGLLVGGVGKRLTPAPLLAAAALALAAKVESRAACVEVRSIIDKGLGKEGWGGGVGKPVGGRDGPPCALESSLVVGSPMPGAAAADKAEVRPASPAAAAKGKGKGGAGNPGDAPAPPSKGEGGAAPGVGVVPVLNGGYGLSRPFRVGVL